jgi:hypothetical protein
MNGAAFTATAGVAFADTVATFTDPGGAGPVSDSAGVHYSASIDWGDGTFAPDVAPGTVAGPFDNGLFTVTGTHIYINAGDYVITTTVHHDTAVDSTPATANVTVYQPTPVLTGISPNAAIAGAAATTITATGTNFLPTSTIDFNGTPLVTTFVNSTQETAVLPATDLAVAGTDAITVATPGGGTSAAQTFTVNNATPTVSTFASEFNRPVGLVFDAAGNLYVANQADGTVSKVTPAGVVSTFATGFRQPRGLAFDAAGDLFVANFGDNTVSEITLTGEITFASGFNGPTGLTFDAHGNLYVANINGTTVSEVTPASVPSLPV